MWNLGVVKRGWDFRLILNGRFENLGEMCEDEMESIMKDLQLE